MNLHYKIVEVHEAENSIVVRYFTDEVTEEDLAMERDGDTIVRCRSDINITMPETPLDDAALHERIIEAAPWQWLRVKEQAARGESAVKGLQKKLHKQVTDVVDPDGPQTLKAKAERMRKAGDEAQTTKLGRRRVV